MCQLVQKAMRGEELLCQYQSNCLLGQNGIPKNNDASICTASSMSRVYTLAISNTGDVHHLSSVPMVSEVSGVFGQ